ncbi:MAG: sigma-E factor negative regulatory protein [Betaproteobacteria bacterium]
MSQPPHSEASRVNTQELSVTISAWMDGDDVASMPEAVLSEQGRQTWQVYHLIGDTLRTPELAIPPTSDLRARIAQALVTEPAIIAAPRPPQVDSKQKRTGNIWRTIVWPRVAMAAAVASVVWVARPFLLPDSGVSGAQMAGAVAPKSAVASNVDAPAVRDYVSAHRQLSGPANVRQASFGASR